jgi:hypothetical protein
LREQIRTAVKCLRNVPLLAGLFMVALTMKTLDSTPTEQIQLDDQQFTKYLLPGVREMYRCCRVSPEYTIVLG